MKKIYYGLMLAGALTLCTGCSSSLLDIDNPNEVTNDTYWNTIIFMKATTYIGSISM